MNRSVFKDAFVWGFLLWLVGYILGIILFMFVPASLLGWIIMPFGILISLWVLLRKINQSSIKYYLLLSVSWTLIAVIFDYFFLVKLFKPADGYYKLDVFLYYVLTFLLLLIIGWCKKIKVHEN